MENIGISKINKALIINKDGKLIGTAKFNPKKEKFEYQNRAYFTKNLESVTYFTIKGLFFKRYFFLYHVDSPEPLNLDIELVRKKQIIPDTALIGAILRSDVLQKLNKGNPLKALFDNPKMLLIVLGIIAVIVYFLSGGSLT